MPTDYVVMVAVQAGIPYDKAFNVLRFMAGWDLPIQDELYDIGINRVIGSMNVLETLGAKNETIRAAMRQLGGRG